MAALILTFNPLSGEFDYIAAPSASGVTSSSPTVDNAIARYDGTTGTLIQDSQTELQDGGGIKAQGFIGRKEIDDAVEIPPQHYMIASGLTIMATGSIFIGIDSELILT